jgi:DNA-binding CsgD family transcriptional regulator
MVRILNNSDLGKLKNTLKNAFMKIKGEFDDHRDSINQNTNEIQSNYEYLCRIDSKIDKLSERIDELTMFMQQDQSSKDYKVSDLTSREKEVFLVLYANEAELGYKEIARKSGLTENLVICYISNLMTKGIPILKKYVEGDAKLIIDPDFKEYQMKNNVVGINETLSHSVTY